MLGAGVGAVYGSYMARKAQENSDRKAVVGTLGLNEETQNKILNAKKTNGQPVFSQRGVEILAETAKMNDTKFFSHVMKNIDGINEIRKNHNGCTKGYTSYEMSANTDKGTTYAHMITNGKNVAMEIVDSEGNITTYREYNNNHDELSESLLKTETVKKRVPTRKKNGFRTVKEEITLADEKVTYDKQKNTIHRENYDIKTPELLSNEKIIQFLPNGVIKDTRKTEYDYTDLDNVIGKTTSKDYVHGAEINAVSNEYYDEVQSLTRVYTNPKTGRQEKIVMELSDVAGVYNSKIVDDKGNERAESIVKTDDEGNVTVKKDLESLDGTRTLYDYSASKDGHNVKMHYEIIDAEGKVLTTVDRTFNRVSPTLAYSSVNGNSYVIEKQEKAFVVTDNFTGEKREIKFKDIFKNSESRKHPEILDKLSGDMLINMHDREYKYCYSSDPQDCYMDPELGVIVPQDNLFAFSHEQGHAKDFLNYNSVEFMELEAGNLHLPNDELEQLLYSGKISSNPVFKAVYEQERADFMKAFPNLEQSYLDYFIDKIAHYGGETGGAEETVAEANALLSPDSGQNDISMRGYYLQKYFPRTIAAASTFLMPHSNIYVGK